MACGKVIAQFKQDSGFYPSGIIPCHTHLNGKAVYSGKGRFQFLIHQQVRIVI